MDTRKIGGLDVSVVGLGCNNFGSRIDARQAASVTAACLDAGVTFFDTADVYGQGLSEEYLGKALGSRRAEAVVATKFGADFTGEPAGRGGLASWVHAAVEGSLRRLGTDYIDLFQLHVPDDATPIAETLGALDDLVKNGKVREIGCSNFSVDQIEGADVAAADGSASAFVSVQNQYSLLHREPEDGVLEASIRSDLGFLPFFPLHAGLLSGKYSDLDALPAGSRLATYPKEKIGRFANDDSFAAVAGLSGFAAANGRTILELAFSWLLAQKPVVSVVAGATKPEQVEANAAAADWSLTPDDLAAVDSLLANGG